MEGPSGTLAVTLLRSFGQCAPAQQCIDGQMLGSYAYCFGLLPLSPNTSWGEIQRCQDCLATGIETRTDWAAENGKGSHSFFALEGDSSLCFSTLKLPEEGEGLVVRVYNISDHAASGTLAFDRPVKRSSADRSKGTASFRFNNRGAPNKVRACSMENWHGVSTAVISLSSEEGV